MSPLREVFLLALRELRRNLRSVKGFILINLSLLVGCAVAFLMVKLGEQRFNGAPPDDVMRAVWYERVLEDKDVAARWAATPSMLFNLHILFLPYLSIFLIAMMGFDSIAGDVQHRTVRFFLSRSRRASYFVAKTFGTWISVALITLLIGILGWILLIAMAGFGVTEVLTTGLFFWIVSLPISLVWAALGTWLSSLFRTPSHALLTTLGVFFFLYLTRLFSFLSETYKPLRWIYPNTYDTWILGAGAEKPLAALGALLVMTTFINALGALQFQRRDL